MKQIEDLVEEPEEEQLGPEDYFFVKVVPVDVYSSLTSTKRLSRKYYCQWNGKHFTDTKGKITHIRFIEDGDFTVALLLTRKNALVHSDQVVGIGLTQRHPRLDPQNQKIARLISFNRALLDYWDVL